MKKIFRSKEELDLKLIVAQGEAILAKLELLDHKLEEARKQREEKKDDS